MPYIAKGTLYTQYVIKIKFALIHGIELLAFDFIYYPWGESVGDEFVWNSCIRFHPKRRYFGKISVKKNLQTFLVMRSMYDEVDILNYNLDFFLFFSFFLLIFL